MEPGLGSLAYRVFLWMSVMDAALSIWQTSSLCPEAGAETDQTTDAQHCDWVEQDLFMENACPVMPEK